MKQGAPVLKESRTEYLLYVPYDLRHRARRIEGRRWDSARKCWALPKTSRVLADLRFEFGDALVVQPQDATLSESIRRAARRVWHPVGRWVGLAGVVGLIIWAVLYWLGP